ncbi:geranylgeranyl transferase type-1 subunit beta-like protein [Endogone sp. FLAS-F59071]|nr:geranylgeranyl transferase type-1 subunit beta-like protein [Endogone sp. FLAS-F59071]|eukprot:RUS20246.1 geranylgeranyl transferase type-1 subunit beta-like protein [Endogone sp. FLAS-F59071]
MNSENPQSSEGEVIPDFSFKKHVAYLKRSLFMLPHYYTENDLNRMTLAFFCLGGLELLGVLDDEISAQNKKDYIDWIYSQQILPDATDPSLNEYHCGFRGSPWSGKPFDPNATQTSYQSYDSSNLANTYSALANLLILGDDLSRVNRDAIVKTMRHLQTEDGSYIPTYHSIEADLRFTYTACVISYILNDWRGIDIPKAVDYIRRSQVSIPPYSALISFFLSCPSPSENLQTYDFGIAQSPKQESHGGSIYCGIASLALLDRLDEGLASKKDTVYWLLSRQISGFQGRANKPQDTCYSFWLGAPLQILDSFQFVNEECNRGFLMSTQTTYGGFAKYPDNPPDVLHSYMAIASLSMMGEPGFLGLDPMVNVSTRVIEHLKTRTVFWKDIGAVPPPK